MRSTAFVISQPMAIPTAMPRTTDCAKSPTAPAASNVDPVATPIATRKLTSAVASLSRDSPSTISRTRAGAWTRWKVASAATGSVGATTAPSTKAPAHGSPPTTAWAITATPPIVASTSASDSQPSAERSARSSCGEALKPAEVSRGGRKTRKTTSGGSSRSGRPGTKPIARPPTTRTIG